MSEKNEKIIFTARELKMLALEDGTNELIFCDDNGATKRFVHIERGEWIEHNYDYDTVYTCSACNEDFVTIEGTPADNLWNFCPHCGADMRGERNNG